MKATRALFAAVMLCILPSIAAAQRPYTDGPVTEVTFVRVKAGMYDTYVRYLGETYRKQMDAYQKAGLVVGYKVYSASPRNPSDANLILAVTYPNMAALDKSQEFDAISTQVAGSLASQDKAYAERGPMREILGSQLVRELILK